jgi:HD-like signal output (HDOD) protein/CheY-like chemotaxis protein
MKKEILFVGGSRLLGEAFAASSASQDWTVRYAAGEGEALKSINTVEFNAVVADGELTNMFGVDLLDKILQQQPKAQRIVLSDIADVPGTLQCVGRAHYHLVKPCEVSTLMSALEQAIARETWLPSEAVQGLIARMRYVPSPPTLYFQIASEMQSPTGSVDRVGELIAQDPAIAAKVLQLANSAMFGLQLQVAHPSEAVNYLGLETTKALVLVAHTFAPFLHMEIAGLSVESLWHHSVLTGRMARWIAKHQGCPPDISEQAFAAGLLHDFGKLLFAANMAEPFAQVLALARAQQRCMWETEVQVMGTCHAEVGACLLGIWGLPTPLIEAVALHHQPQRLARKDFSPLAAVHIANVLEHEASHDQSVFVPAQLSHAFRFR